MLDPNRSIGLDLRLACSVHRGALAFDPGQRCLPSSSKDRSISVVRVSISALILVSFNLLIVFARRADRNGLPRIRKEYERNQALVSKRVLAIFYLGI